MARAGKSVLRDQIVMKGDTIMIARTKSPKRMIEDVFIALKYKGYDKIVKNASR
jgi:hypothetical protein